MRYLSCNTLRHLYGGTETGYSWYNYTGGAVEAVYRILIYNGCIGVVATFRKSSVVSGSAHCKRWIMSHSIKSDLVSTLPDRPLLLFDFDGVFYLMSHLYYLIFLSVDRCALTFFLHLLHYLKLLILNYKFSTIYLN